MQLVWESYEDYAHETNKWYKHQRQQIFHVSIYYTRLGGLLKEPKKCGKQEKLNSVKKERVIGRQNSLDQQAVDSSSLESQ